MSLGRVVRAYVNKSSSTPDYVIVYAFQLVLQPSSVTLGNRLASSYMCWCPGAGRAVFTRLTPLPVVRVQAETSTPWALALTHVLISDRVEIPTVACKNPDSMSDSVTLHKGRRNNWIHVILSSSQRPGVICDIESVI